ncbi:MAG: hypothetical protein GY856_22460, partial [bacterium]|nr:hypothetical protein [bacterium]
MNAASLALTLLRALLHHPDGGTYRLHRGELEVDGLPLAAPNTGGELGQRFRFLAARLGWADVDPEHLAAAWQQALADGVPRTRHQLLEIAHELSRHTAAPGDTAARWREVVRSRLAPVLASVPWADSFAPGTPDEKRETHLELRPVLEGWPQRLLGDPEWAFAEAPLPEMDPLPLDQVWVDVA